LIRSGAGPLNASASQSPGLLAAGLGVLVSASSFLAALTTSGACRRGARLAAGSRAGKRPEAPAKARELAAEAITVVAIAMMTHEAS
jgi:hypothetical protein